MEVRNMKSQDLGLVRGIVRTILENRAAFPWSVQGFGMMRTYFGEDERFRLNVWHSSLRVPGVSTVHDHPWDFTSWVLAGRLSNSLFEEYEPSPGHEVPVAQRFKHATIKTGEGGGVVHAHGIVCLWRRPLEVYGPGDVYSQKHKEIHETRYADGTVTVNDRTRVGDGEHARVFWPVGQDWVDAEPREAWMVEVDRVGKEALAWF